MESDVSRAGLPQFQHTLAGQTDVVLVEEALVIPASVDSRGAHVCDGHHCGFWCSNHPNSLARDDGGLKKFFVLLDTSAKNISCSSPAIAGV